MADKKVSALSAITNLSQDDLLMVVNDPAGTPESKKVTVGNLFGNVAVDTTHKGNVTFTANTNHTGTTATFSSNVVVGGVNIKTYVEDRIQMANVAATYATNAYVQSFAGSYTTNTDFQSYVANTNARTTTLEANVASATLAIAAKASINNPIFTGTATTPALVVSNTQPNPATSNATTEGITSGTIFYSNTYLYIATDSNTIKRVALSTF